MAWRRRWYPPPQPTLDELSAGARRRIEEGKAAGRELSPVERISGRQIARTFWGRAWCENLLRYSDYENRMPRGRRYVRGGSVIHLEIGAGSVGALVSGTGLYEVSIRIAPLPAKRWAAVRRECAGELGSLVDLLAGQPPERVMEIVSRPGEGLFPAPKEIGLDCSCPDWAAMCKHVAAALYGVGVRLDREPERLFELRGVNPEELVEAALGAAAAGEGGELASDDLSELFGVELEPEPASAPARKKASRKPAAKKAVRKKAAAKKVVRKKAVRKKAVRKKKTVRKKSARGKVPGKPAGRRS